MPVNKFLQVYKEIEKQGKLKEYYTNTRLILKNNLFKLFWAYFLLSCFGHKLSFLYKMIK